MNMKQQKIIWYLFYTAINLLRQKNKILTILAIMTVTLYNSCSYNGSEHIISSNKYKRNFIITSKCKDMTGGHFVPYVTINLGTSEILTAMVDPGYDLLKDCMESIDRIEIKENIVYIYMRNGTIKNINVIGTDMTIY